MRTSFQTVAFLSVLLVICLLVGCREDKPSQPSTIDQIKRLKEKHAQQVTELRGQHQKGIERLKTEYELQIESLRKDIERLKVEHSQQIESLKRQHQTEVESYKKRLQELAAQTPQPPTNIMDVLRTILYVVLLAIVCGTVWKCWDRHCTRQEREKRESNLHAPYPAEQRIKEVAQDTVYSVLGKDKHPPKTS